jgi:hypothetical protein
LFENNEEIQYFQSFAYCKMRISSYLFLPGLDQIQLLLHECSDRLLVSQTYAAESNIKIDDVLMLTNIYNQFVCGTVYGTHLQGPALIFAPSWMTHNLDLLDPITVYHIAKIPPTGLRIRPHSETFASNPDFIKLVNGAISNYKSLSKNTRIMLLINGQVEYLTIDDIFPVKCNTCFVHNCGKVDIKILGTAPPKKENLEYLFKSPVQEDYKFAFFGIGHILGGVAADPTIEPFQAAADAARRRFELISKGQRPY